MTNLKVTKKNTSSLLPEPFISAKRMCIRSHFEQKDSLEATYQPLPEFKISKKSLETAYMPQKNSNAVAKVSSDSSLTSSSSSEILIPSSLRHK